MIRMRFTRKHKGIKMPGPNQCHPSVGDKRPAIGCFPREVLEKVANKLNIVPASGAGLRKQLENALNLKGKGEESFLMALPLVSSEHSSLKKMLRPSQPKSWTQDPDKWLDSLNISAVLNQYEHTRKDFEFMGPFPIDFGAPNPYRNSPTNKDQCLMNEMCTLSVQNSVKNGTSYIGIVYNLDPHYKSGSHWVANFIDLKKKICIYFDSYGMEPPLQVQKFMRWLTTHDPEIKLYYSSRRLQYKNTECGMYCLYFIIRMLAGDDYIAFSRSKPSDSDMLKLRSWIFAT
jgi:hypothetical protein